jgi:uroporphyrinogen-III synthase
MQSNDLKGVKVLVTRPAHQNQKLCDLVRTHGGEPVVCPLINIEPTYAHDALLTVFTGIDESDIAIFVSTNAVTHGLGALRSQGQTLSELTQVFAVGPTTALMLQAAGIRVDGVPLGLSGANGLRALPIFRNVSNRRVVVFRGNGGEPSLVEWLKHEGASVFVAETYRRVMPIAINPAVVELCQQGTIDVITLTSVTSVEHLFALLPDNTHQMLKNATVVTLSQRIAQYCENQGFQGAILVADEANDQALVETIVHHCDSVRQGPRW